MRNLRFLLLLMLITPFVVHADNGISVKRGFITGNTFRALDQPSKNVYATGLVDGILLAPFYGAPEERLNNFERCTAGMTGQQIVAIFEKHLKENPERWHHDMHIIAFSALREACK